MRAVCRDRKQISSCLGLDGGNRSSSSRQENLIWPDECVVKLDYGEGCIIQ